MSKGYPCRDAILDQIAACGPVDFFDAKHECAIQATDYSPENVQLALIELLRDEMIEMDYDFEDIADPTSDANVYYDLTAKGYAGYM